MELYQKMPARECDAGVDENMEILNNGESTELDQKEQHILREQDRKILENIAFAEKNVLYLGCGRGEKICFALREGAKACIAVDSSQNAVKVAREQVSSSGFSKEKVAFFCEDILDFVQNHCIEVRRNSAEMIDIVILLDSVENIPRNQLSDLLTNLHGLLSLHSIVVINTPCYKYDNDVMANGLDKRNHENLLNSSNMNDLAMAGMHCNLFTTISLQQYFLKCGFLNITEAHFYVRNTHLDAERLSKISYLQRWNVAKEEGFPLRNGYCEDEIEYPYSDSPELERFLFHEGILDGITLLTTKEYCDLAFHDGNIDVEAISDFRHFIETNKHAVIFDVGGFMGANSMVYAKLAGSKATIVVFEPNPYNRNRILRNLSFNPELAGQIMVEPYALSSEDGTCEMTLSSNIDSGYSSTSRLEVAHAKIHETYLPAGFVKHTIQTLSLDSYIHKSQLIPNIIKVDIEGAEHMLLQGASNTLQKYKPIFYIEYHSEYCATMCSQLLNMHGFQVYPCQEEPDNRLIVKASFVQKSTYGAEELMNITIQQSAQISMLLQSISSLTQHNDRQREEVAISKQTLAALQQERTTLQHECATLQQAQKCIQSENTRLQQRLTEMLNSKSWKVTKPLRQIESIMKQRH
ncbi:MAG: class I SAM-dependent methyltransferase [Candidatus Limiplasma sp.]|nr:class I SAM-dependent methyltransferase [Candidatus Limiplasma sp.]